MITGKYENTRKVENMANGKICTADPPHGVFAEIVEHDVASAELVAELRGEDVVPIALGHEVRKRKIERDRLNTYAARALFPKTGGGLA